LFVSAANYAQIFSLDHKALDPSPRKALAVAIPTHTLSLTGTQQKGQAMAGGTNPSDPMVSVAWLAHNLHTPDVRIVDASSFMPGSDRDAKSEYQAGHIPGAVFFDIDEIADTQTDLPHMMASAEKFASRVRKLGIGDGLRIVVYDSQGLFSAPRVWWMLRHMGHDDVVVLDGGLPAWVQAGLPLEDLPPIPRERHFTVRRRADLIRDMAQMREKLATGTAQVVDARSAGRFEGSAPEPRAGLPSGHMQGARNVPFTTLLTGEGMLKDPDSLRAIFAAAGVDLTGRIVTTCGSGITACVLALALARLGRWDVPVYDGSWAQWASLPENLIVTGPPS
jgi:thiosulfate/3-mercaptopyruvate sulfurtransferase